jgi:hypothetical protein
MYTPSFPFLSNQVMLASDRIHLLAKTDAVILMGQESVILSSANEVHINANNATLIDSPKIELGSNAQSIGQPVILGRDFIRQLMLFLQQVSNCGSALETVGQTNLADMASKIVDVGCNLKSSADKLNDYISLDQNLSSKVLSNVTYTR